MIVRWDRDDWFCYTLHRYGKDIDLPEEFVSRFRDAERDFSSVQAEMREYVKADLERQYGRKLMPSMQKSDEAKT